MTFNRRERGSTGPRGGRKFGAAPWKGGSEYRERPAMFPAVCSECGERCEVPFKPNGSKPVLCNGCFGKDDFHDRRPARAPRPETRHFDDRGNNQLMIINKKLDTIIKALVEKGVVEEDLF